MKLEKLKLKPSRGRAERDGEKRVRNRTRSLLFSFLSHNLSEFYLVSKHLGISTYCCCSLVKKWDGGGCCQEGVERTRSLRPTVGILSHLRSPAHNSNRLNNLLTRRQKRKQHQATFSHRGQKQTKFDVYRDLGSNTERGGARTKKGAPSSGTLWLVFPLLLTRSYTILHHLIFSFLFFSHHNL